MLCYVWYVCMYVFMYVCMYVCLYVCLCVCMCARTPNFSNIVWVGGGVMGGAERRLDRGKRGEEKGEGVEESGKWKIREERRETQVERRQERGHRIIDCMEEQQCIVAS